MNYIECKLYLIRNIKLYQNYPSSFKPSTVISYSLSKESNVTLKVFNLIGEEIATLVNKEQEAGYYEVVFSNNKLGETNKYMYKISLVKNLNSTFYLKMNLFVKENTL